MNPARRRQEVEAEAHRPPSETAAPERHATGADPDARAAGRRLKELRKSLGKTQTEVAATLGISQSRVSQIENGDLDAMELETLRAYAAALGGHVDVTISVGPHSVKIG